MVTYLTTRWGNAVENPSAEEMLASLRELEKRDEEHPDCWLNSEDGWSISVFQSGLIVFENVETGEGPWHLKGMPRDTALRLWQLLQANELSSIKKQPWNEGYGNT